MKSVVSRESLPRFHQNQLGDSGGPASEDRNRFRRENFPDFLSTAITHPRHGLI